jgi:hypothetical protein
MQMVTWQPDHNFIQNICISSPISEVQLGAIYVPFIQLLIFTEYIESTESYTMYLKHTSAIWLLDYVLIERRRFIQKVNVWKKITTTVKKIIHSTEPWPRFAEN